MTNLKFLTALFKEDLPFVHVTDFPYDPGNIPSDKHLIAWKGDWWSRYRLTANTNQYFTISIFNPDDTGGARRRKALFLRTRVIVLDDVKEKLSMDAVGRLPQPAWVLETSPGSEQWGYILSSPCHDRVRVENLLDGLVANGLAPEGRDPGMKGTTRYVRLPEGVNTKAGKMVNGQPFKCVMKEWHPERTTTMGALAAPFNVNLDMVRREARTDGAADIPDHPLLHIPDIIKIKEVRSNGRFDITCPWVDEHTGEDDSGSAIFTNDDGSLGFKCHHGGCMGKTAKDLLRYIDSLSPGFKDTYSRWQTNRVFSDISSPPVVSFMDQGPTTSTPSNDQQGPDVEILLDLLLKERPTSSEARILAQKILRLLEQLPTIERQHWHNEVCDHMHWSKTDFRQIIKDLRSEWYATSKDDTAFLTNIIFIKPKNRFYDYDSQEFYTPEAFQNSFVNIDVDARKTALQDGAVDKVDKIDFAPRQPRIYERRGIRYGNTWCASNVSTGSPGDCSRWLNHWDAMGWTEHRNHHLQWMAYTLKHPEDKINHMLLFGGMEGTGKDFLFHPLIKAMGDYSTTIDGHELLMNHNEYLLSTKLLIINETDLGDHHESRQISNKLKPLAAAPPDTLRVNPKGITAVNVTNIVNCSMTTNSQLPIKLNGPSRRFYATWTSLNVRDETDEMRPDWVNYWSDRWTWMNGGGFEQCIHYLLNEVDISNFNPGAAPPMTDFLRNIREASKSPGQQTIETFIRGKVGAFRSDLVTSTDMSTTIRAAGMLNPEMLQADANWFTPTRIGRILSDVTSCAQLQGKEKRKDKWISIRVWAVRNTDKYMIMPQSLILREYEQQIAKCKNLTKLQVMK
jgi:hypothetical protein